MTVVWILFVCSVVLLPATALLALRWAARHGEFNDLQHVAISIFDEEEPLGVMTDHFPGEAEPKQIAQAPCQRAPRSTDKDGHTAAPGASSTSSARLDRP